MFLFMQSAYGYVWNIKSLYFPDHSLEGTISLGSAMFAFILVYVPYWHDLRLIS